MAYIGSSPTKVVSRQSANIFTYTATANQTAFTGADANGNTLACSPSDIMVHMNGIKLEESDYTASTTTVTLVSGAAAGDEVTITAFLTFESADHYTKSAADTRYVNASGDTMTGDLIVNSNVGIGTSSPSSNNGALSRQIEIKGTNNNCITGTTDTSGMSGLLLEARDSTRSPQPRYAQIGMQSDTSGNGTMSFFTAAASGYVTEKMKIDASGRVTKPNQPAFSAYLQVSPPTAYVSGSRILNFTTVVHNIGSHYDGTNKFTAPVAGLYRFSCDRSLNTQGQNQVIRHPEMAFYVNGSLVYQINTGVSVSSAVTTTSYTHFVVNMGTELYLNANDYVQVNFNYGNSPSTLYEYWRSYFSGFLIG